MRLEPIFKNNKLSSKSDKNKEILNLLSKKHKLDRTLQISLEKEMYNKSCQSNESNEATFSFSNTLKLNSNIIIKKKI